MRFTIKREEFLKGLNIANRAVSNKIAMPVLENLKLELTDRGLFRIILQHPRHHKHDN